MGIDKLKKKSVASGKKSAATFLKVNKYENSDMALNLIAHICTKDTDISVVNLFSDYINHVNSMTDRFREEESIDTDKGDYSVDRLYSLEDACRMPYWLLPDEIENTNGHFSQTIAVCGGYSSGKSSFLNNLLETSNALPTGIEPVSMINTYINCPKDATQLTVKGRNVKDKLVRLNREVLDCIQHSSKTKVYVGSVLDTLYIDFPLPKDKDYLKELTFIDTPGYNNSNDVNSENNQSDKQTAQEAMGDSDAIIWCIDIEAGTISKNDFDMINSVNDGEDNQLPVLIVFTKMDKKPADEVAGILEEAKKKCERYLTVQPIDIIAYSSFKKENYVVSLSALENGKSHVDSSTLLKSTFTLLKQKAGEPQNVDYWCSKVKSYFSQEIEASNEQLDYLEGMRLKLADRKDEVFRSKGEQDENTSINLNDIKDIMLDNYDELHDYGSFLAEQLAAEIQLCGEALDREYEWDNSSMFAGSDSLRRRHNHANDVHQSVLDSIEGHEYPGTYTKKDRKELYNMIESYINYGDNTLDESTDVEQQYKDVVELKAKFKDYVGFLKRELIETPRILRECSKNALAEVDKRISKMQSVNQVEHTDIFSAIAGDNVPKFLECFSTGVDLTKCNEQGFSPITFVARCSNNVMMKFFIRHHVDFTMKDRRGYNALETAAIYHCQDICELLMDADNNLIYESQSLGKLADNSIFKDWISKY